MSSQSGSFSVKSTKWSYNQKTSQSESNISQISGSDKNNKPETIHDSVRTQGSASGLSIKSVPGAAMEDYL